MPLEETKKHTNGDNQPLISIITPLYNAGSFISETIRSVQAQTLPNWEHLIVDDASSDDSLAIARTFAERDGRIKITSLHTNKGAAVCRNLATEQARGRYIAFLDADDLWHPEKLLKQLNFMEQHDCPVSYTNYLHIDSSGNSLRKRVLALKELPYSRQLRNNYVGNLTGMYDAERLGKITAPSIRKRQDWAVWLEAIKRSGKPAKGIREDLAYYRVHHDSMSSNKWKLIKYNFRFYREHLRFSRLKSTVWLLRFFFEYFFVRPRQIQNL